MVRRGGQAARALFYAAYLPTFLAEIGIGAILPVLTLSVLDMDYPAVVASLAVAAYSGGRIVGSGVGGSLAHRWGGARSAMLALATIATGAFICAVSPLLVPFIFGAVVIGLGHAGFHVARQAQVHDIAPVHARARALTTLAGVWRIANFIGPLVASALLAAWGDYAAYLFAVGCVGAGMLALRLAPAWDARHLEEPAPRVSVPTVARENARVLRTLGVAVLATGALRAARIAVVPLWATHVGLSPHVATLIYSVSAAIDMLLFYPAGSVMDRFGRKWTGVPSNALLGIGMLALPFTHGFASVTIAAVILGIGNGWGSGLIMTLAADVAPPHGRNVFTGLWSIFQDVGGLTGPALISIGAAFSLSLGLGLVGVLGLATAGALAAWIPPWKGRPGSAADGAQPIM